MRTITFLTILTLLIALPWGNKINAQAHAAGDVSLNAGVSLGVYGYGWYSGVLYSNVKRTGIVPISASLNFGVSDMFSVGGFAGYYSRKYKYTYDNRGNSIVYKDKFTNIAFGAQGTFHAVPFFNDAFDTDIDDEKVDFYARLLLGYETYSWKYDNPYLEGTNTTGSVIFSPVVGVRYMFNPNLGVYLEGGRGAYGWGNIGLSFKL